MANTLILFHCLKGFHFLSVGVKARLGNRLTGPFLRGQCVCVSQDPRLNQLLARLWTERPGSLWLYHISGQPPRPHAGRGEGLTHPLGPRPRVLPSVVSAFTAPHASEAGVLPSSDSRTKGRASAQAQSRAAGARVSRPAPHRQPAPCLPRGWEPSATQGSLRSRPAWRSDELIFQWKVNPHISFSGHFA